MPNLILRTLFLVPLIAINLAGLTIADAGDLSERKVLGFSPNGKHFVFEEFGIRDGTGAPYVNLYAVNVDSDRWVEGTPVRREGSEEQMVQFEKSLQNRSMSNPLEIAMAYDELLAKTRQSNLTTAKPILAPLGDLQAAQQRAHNPPHEFTSDAKTVRFSIIDYVNLVNSYAETKVWRLQLSEREFPAAENCYEMHERMFGFVLVLINEKSGEEIVLNDDKRIPNSRRCPQKYQIEEVLTHPRADGSFSLAVLVRYARLGFEGPDGRLLAVTTVVRP